MKVDISEDQITRLVEEVIQRVREEPGIPAETPSPPRPLSLQSPSPAGAGVTDGVFPSMDDAIAAAGEAYQAFSTVGLEKRKAIIQAMREGAIAQAEPLARMAVEETGLGRVEAKVQKNLLAARKTPGTEDLVPVTYTGDHGLTLVELAPYGVIGSITPTTNPSSTIINNSISMVAAGNSAVFNPHPGAKGVSNETVRVLNRAIQGAGGPVNLLCSIAEPTLETSQAVMQHPGIKMLMVTGGGAVVILAMTCGKKIIAAGPGNPPVIVDDTANIRRAARCIVDGASFDNNILCIAEKEVFVFRSVAEALKADMLRYGAHEITGAQIDDITKILVEPDIPFPHPKRDFIGKDARVLLEQIGVQVGDDVRLVICEVPSADHPLVQAEMLMPILPIVRVDDLEEAFRLAKEAEHGYKHTSVMHSESVSNMSRVARDIETTIFVKNAPSFAGLGFNGEGFTTLSIAGPTGEGLTSARCFTRQRRCVLAEAFRIV